ncbi:MAG: phosphoribosylformylglycinamidine synthase I [bacterium]
MADRPRALLLKFPGTNCDRETARGLRTVGFDAKIMPFSRVDREEILTSDLIAFSGGFSYGDYIQAGRLARLEIERKLQSVLSDFRDEGGYLLGICNGFQILQELDLLPEGSLIQNESRRFICQWTGLEVQRSNDVFLTDLPDNFELPIAHMEGRFVTADGNAQLYIDEGLVSLRYRDNPNGSEARIAGLRDRTGRVMGLMPHPERFLRRSDHYTSDWDEAEWGWGYYFFKSLRDTIEAPSGKVTGGVEV